MPGVPGFFQSRGTYARSACVHLDPGARSCRTVLGSTVSQCRPSMFVPDNPYSAKTERNWITNCVNVFSYQR
jgi:hypothetical protein